MNIVEKLIALRKLKKVPIYELAKYIGISRNSLSRMERAKDMKVKYAFRYAEYLGCQIKIIIE